MRDAKYPISPSIDIYAVGPMEPRVAQRKTRRRMQRTWSPPPVVSELLPDHGVDTDREISPLFPAHCSLRYELMEAPEL